MFIWWVQVIHIDVVQVIDSIVFDVSVSDLPKSNTGSDQMKQSKYNISSNQA